ncbi:non-lysosomal glucosylceramidase [Acidobacteria bacterium AH-259-O06]|nr:non-lysosomal glucosylceramidase [Acidobacteria bacterium AH-259-O06]
MKTRKIRQEEKGINRREFVKSTAAGMGLLTVGMGSVSASAEQVVKQEWPVLTRYDQNHLEEIAFPLGGIGTGTISLGGRGDLRHWEIMNQPNKEFVPRYSFFALYMQPSGGRAVSRVLEGQITPPYSGPFGCPVKNAGLPRFHNCSFHAAYPLGQVLLSDPDVPINVRIEAFNPLIPGDPDLSGIPVAILRFVLSNKTASSVYASVCGSLLNFIGTDGIGGAPKQNKNEFKRGNGVQGLFMYSKGVNPDDERFGTMALTTTASTGVSYRTSWAQLSWANAMLDFWDDFSGDGKLEERGVERPEGGIYGVTGAADEDAPMGSLDVALDIPSGRERAVTFLLTWHFPNRQTWTPKELVTLGPEKKNPNRVGNYYTTKYRDAWEVAVRTANALPQLEADTVKFVRAFCDSDLPVVVKEAALYNVNTLRTQTCFRTEDGHFFGWEGSCQTKGWQVWDWGQPPLEQKGCCFGSCTHVWNYEQATAFLFGDLARKMREVEFLYATRQDGQMSFRVSLPLERATEYDHTAADGQMGCVMKLYRDWQLYGDDGWLRTLWPKARKALEFCWIEGGWDADRDGVMEGAQHNTMDVEYHGANPQMGSWYLGALRAAEKMARRVNDEEFANNCRRLFERGSRWIDKNLFNGEFYEHKIRRPIDESGKRIEPRLQLGAGCLVDQLVGQYMAHICGLGYLLNKDQVATTLRSIMKYNFKENFYDHFNNMRTYVLNDESGLLMATYPLGRRPKEPFPYYNEVMTGFEYTAAIGMLYEGQTQSGLKCIRAIRDRYDGKKRNPFNEGECGHHYARAMASWATVLALTGFHYSAVEESLEFAATDKPSQFFWSNGYSWGTLKQTPSGDRAEVELTVLHGEINVKKTTLTGLGSVEEEESKSIQQGQTLKLLVSKA